MFAGGEILFYLLTFVLFVVNISVEIHHDCGIGVKCKMQDYCPYFKNLVTDKTDEILRALFVICKKKKQFCGNVVKVTRVLKMSFISS